MLSFLSSDAVNLLFVIDSSTLSETQLNVLLEFITKVVADFRFEPEGDRIAIVIFSDQSQEAISFDSYVNMIELFAVLRLLKISNGRR